MLLCLILLFLMLLISILYYFTGNESGLQVASYFSEYHVLSSLYNEAISLFLATMMVGLYEYRATLLL